MSYGKRERRAIGPGARMKTLPQPTRKEGKKNRNSPPGGLASGYCAAFVDVEAPSEQEPEKAYVYTDEVGNTLFRVLRLPGKQFRQQAWDAEAERWLPTLAGVGPVLYRLPELIAAVEAQETVFVCEGEKDVLAIEAAGAVATTGPGGAGKWREEFSPYLAGAAVVVVQDKDGPGHLHALAVRDSLKPYAASVRLVQAATGKDAYDHLAAGYDLDDFVPARRYGRRKPKRRPALPAPIPSQNGSGGLEAVLGRLPDAVEVGRGQWSSKCPAHDDQVRSLSVGVGEWRPVLIHCHAGCEASEVLAAIGLTWREVL